jgi:hypothetical protein
VQTTINNGSVGVAPGTAITGDRNYQLLAGEEEINSSDAIQCTDDLLTAYRFSQDETCLPSNTLPTSDLAGKTECRYSISCLLYWIEPDPISL